MSVSSEVKSLSPVERSLVENLFVSGPAAMLEAGLSRPEQEEFLRRGDVQAYIRQLDESLKDHNGTLSRTRFVTQKHLQRLAPTAVRILDDALHGTVYRRKRDGSIKTERKVVKGVVRHVPVVEHYAPEEIQLEAAKDVLDRLGVHDKGEVNNRAGVNVNILVNDGSSPEVLQYPEGETEQERIAARERVRATIEMLAPLLPKARQFVESRLKESHETDTEDHSLLSAEERASSDTISG